MRVISRVRPFEIVKRLSGKSIETLKMGKKGKGKGNKLAKMSEEERARYLQMRADAEEETRRRKMQLIALYMKVGTIMMKKLFQLISSLPSSCIEQTEARGCLLPAEHGQNQSGMAQHIAAGEDSGSAT